MKSVALQIFNFSLSNKADSEFDIYIDGDIVDASTQELMKNWWGDETSTSYKSFRNQIQDANPKTLNVYVNSTGGHVGDAMAMHDFLIELENNGVKVNRRGRGIIASAATYLVMGNNSEMSENSFMMIHNVQMLAYGDINQVENQVKAGRKFNDRIRDFYSNISGQAPETISGWMNKETWFTAQEAKDKGFVKNITGNATFKNSIKEDSFPYNNISILNQYNSFIKNDNQMNVDIKKITNAIEEKFNVLLDKLGLVNKKEDQPTIDALSEFSTSLANSIAAQIKEEAAGISEERVGELINEAFTKIADNASFKTALANATKDLLNKTQLDAATATLANKTDLANLKNEIVTAITGKAGTPAGEKINNNEKIQARRKTSNRFSGVPVEEWQV